MCSHVCACHKAEKIAFHSRRWTCHRGAEVNSTISHSPQLVFSLWECEPRRERNFFDLSYLECCQGVASRGRDEHRNFRLCCFGTENFSLLQFAVFFYSHVLLVNNQAERRACSVYEQRGGLQWGRARDVKPKCSIPRQFSWWRHKNFSFRVSFGFFLFTFLAPGLLWKAQKKFVSDSPSRRYVFLPN